MSFKKVPAKKVGEPKKKVEKIEEVKEEVNKNEPVCVICNTKIIGDSYGGSYPYTETNEYACMRCCEKYVNPAIKRDFKKIFY